MTGGRVGAKGRGDGDVQDSAPESEMSPLGVSGDVTSMQPRVRGGAAPRAYVKAAGPKATVVEGFSTADNAGV